MLKKLWHTIKTNPLAATLVTAISVWYIDQRFDELNALGNKTTLLDIEKQVWTIATSSVTIPLLLLVPLVITPLVLLFFYYKVRKKQINIKMIDFKDIHDDLENSTSNDTSK